MFTHPTPEQMQTLKLDVMAKAFVELQDQDRAKDLVTPTGWPCCSTARSPTARPDASKRGCARRTCATAKPRSRMSTTARRVGWTNPCSSSW